MASKSLFLMNYLLLILYMSWNLNEKQTVIGSSVPLLISSLMLIDVTYIQTILTLLHPIIYLLSVKVPLSVFSSPTGRLPVCMASSFWLEAYAFSFY